MDAYELRARARKSLKGNYWTAVAAAFVASVFGALLANGGSFNLDLGNKMSDFFSELPNVVKICLAIAIGSAVVLSLVSFILGGVVQLGYARYLLKQHDGEPCSVKDLFSQFDRFGQGFLQALLRGIYTFLWSLLLVIPGVIKAYAYVMTPFIMAENPNLTANEAIKLSQEKMKGHKGDLFWLGLTFFGWSILAVLTCGIGYIFLNPYMNAAYAAFYRDRIAPKTSLILNAETIPQIDVEI